ncbi:hypothetical protein U9M48_043614, partial [Paspalum notatum var. saurae]
MESADKTLFLLKHGKDLLIVQIYMDDIIFDEQGVRDEHDGELQFFLGLQIRQTPQGTFVHQSKYTRDLLRKFEMADASPQMTPMSTSTALDADEDGKEIDQKAGYEAVIIFGSSPRESHRTAVKRILRYIKFTPNPMDACYPRILWMLDYDYGLTYGRIPILCDSSSTISVAKNPVLHSRTKHIDVRYHFLRDNYEKSMIDIVKVASENQVADILTKPLDLETFARLRGEL